jgi:hypothetical protein
MLTGRAASLAFCVACVLGCGGAGQGVVATSPSELTGAQIDADPLALLPGSPVVVATVDARAFYASGSLGAELAALSEQLAPIGEEAGFKASRDVDRIVLGTYAAEGLDVAAVLSGRFDEAKIKQAADGHARTRAGGVIVASRYTGRSVYAVGDLGFCVLTPRTALTGTQTGIRRVLDRIHDGSTKRELLPWVEKTVETPNAAAALTADFAQPLAEAAIGSFPLPWLRGVKAVRILADFKPPGMHVAGTVTYADASSASSGASGMRQVGTMANLVALTGLAPRLQELSVNTADANVECAFSVDDGSLRNLLGSLPKWIR